MHDVSASGVKVRVIARYTAPAGFEIKRFADDADPYDVEDVDIASSGITVNGELVIWTTPAGVRFNVSVLPGTDDDDNLARVWTANRVGANKVAIHDIITVIVTLPSGKTSMFTNGSMLSGPPATSASSDARLKTKTYGFVFETVV